MGNENHLDFSLPFFKLHSIEVIRLFCCCYKSNLNTKSGLERYNHLLILLISPFLLTQSSESTLLCMAELTLEFEIPQTLHMSRRREKICREIRCRILIYLLLSYAHDFYLSSLKNSEIMHYQQISANRNQ